MAERLRQAETIIEVQKSLRAHGADADQRKPKQRREAMMKAAEQLDEDNASKERRNHLQRPNYKKPQLLATARNQVWSWDISKLLGPEKWTSCYLYVISHIFSRYVVG